MYGLPVRLTMGETVQFYHCADRLVRLQQWNRAAAITRG